MRITIQKHAGLNEHEAFGRVRTSYAPFDRIGVTRRA